MSNACVLVSKEGGSVVNFFIGKPRVLMQTSRPSSTWLLTSLYTPSSGQSLSLTLSRPWLHTASSFHEHPSVLLHSLESLPPLHGWLLVQVYTEMAGNSPTLEDHSLKGSFASWPANDFSTWFLFKLPTLWQSFKNLCIKLELKRLCEPSSNPVLCILTEPVESRAPVGAQCICSE